MVPTPPSRTASGCRRIAWACCAAAIAALRGAALHAADEADAPLEAPPDSRYLARLIAELDHEQYLVRVRAEQQLLQLGPGVVPAVMRAAQHDSAEVRLRARRILLVLQHTRWLEQFQALARRDERADIDLEHAALLVTEVVEGHVDRAAVARWLDELARRVRRRLPPDVEPHAADPQQVVDALRHVLFAEAGLGGALDDFDDPANSSLKHVLETGRGLPITLSVVVVLVAQRLNVPIAGLAIPYRYMVKYDGRKAPAAAARNDIIFDPYAGGRILTVDELEDLVAGLGGGFDPLRHLLAVPHRTTVARMLRNLEADYRQQGNHAKAWQVAQYLRALEGDSASPSLPQAP
jgi:regulator of sirC expression with transglutaminase-like and TPR domain